MRPRFKFETKLLAAFGLALIVFVALAASAWESAREIRQATQRVAQSQEVLEHLADAKAESLLIELNTQNFRLSGDAEFLAGRDAAIAASELSLRRIKELTAENPRQRERLAQLRATADEWLAISRSIERRHRTEGAAAASAYLPGAPLRETRERLFATLREMVEEEHRMLQQRSAEQTRVRELRNALAAITTFLLAALLATKGELPEVILMDLELPDVSGVELTRRLKSSPRLASIPVVMITGHSDKSTVVECLKAGAVDFVVKPLDREILLGKLRGLLSG